LSAIGFTVTGLAARVLWTDPTNTNRPRSHMLLKVPVEGVDHVADVGFGGLTLTAPLVLAREDDQPTPHEPFRLVRERGSYTMEAMLPSGWRALYRFDMQEQLPADYEVASWYLTHHPASQFRTTLMAARPASDRRYALIDNRLTVRFLDGRSETRALESGSALRRSLEGDFRLDLSDIEDLDERLEAIAAGNRQGA
jgi:N-hydroxyarylamine O-acetyltransferase